MIQGLLLQPTKTGKEGMPGLDLALLLGYGFLSLTAQVIILREFLWLSHLFILGLILLIFKRG